MKKSRRPAVFLDRDGTINVEKSYLHRVEDFEFIPAAAAAIRRLNEAGFLVIVVTNQSGVARGYYGLDDVDALHRHLQGELGKVGAFIDAFYVCPHHPSEGVGAFGIDCSCRKGRPGMLLRAAEDHHIDLARSFMVGDKAADVEAGLRAGCRSLLVLTGYGKSEAELASALGGRPVADLAAAVDYVLGQGIIKTD
ncbi:D-glycero-beta-D-manno-heptose 1,7-bisphosphate 7-phosphatase [uncultured Desulfuromonas sp.]|uniref:D-glycero-beta-D-manno-heptose 1,7-bisphosphate 7-phosphatase n=1 Tax=uncultured Desulfuromonas sp. TaxID=181013 RepID=UPI002635FB44|nr:D-glycero-beta-D-manno-heptose 1,7-bisphosphate 7-phosphatase [uncultured Desulfuromonas sp.]